MPSPQKVLRFAMGQLAILQERHVHIRRAKDQVVPAGPGLFTFGHSYMAGFAGDEGADMWPVLVARELGLPLVNRAVGGDSSSNTKARAKLVNGRPGNGDLVLVESGLRDMCHYGYRPTIIQDFRANLQAIVAQLSAGGATVRVVSDPFLVEWDALPRTHTHGSDVLAAAFRDVALAHPGGIDTWPGWDPTTMLAPDRVHPNRSGVEHLAAAVLAALKAPLASS
jgi:lysophospholipase L1-like esterase